ncbi:MAG: alkaline phosphatase family protein [Sulfolobaceae archaeon]|nr:alkaline phosphatase family protein [Sulfolobaceae archaeon]
MESYYNIIEPNYNDKNNNYSLACGIANFLGVKRNCENHVEIEGKRFLLILVDGLGYDLFTKVYRTQQIKGVEVVKGYTVFPSTTATVITTLFTALTPAEHGVLGYITFSKVLGSLVNSLRYSHPSEQDRDSLKDGLSFSKAFPEVRSYLEDVKDKNTVEIIPKGIEQTEFTIATHGKMKETRTYTNYWDGIYNLRKVLEDEKYEFVYFYIDAVDSLEHKYGALTEPVLEAATTIVNDLISLAVKFKDKFSTVLTADHGQVTVEKMIKFNDDRRLLEMVEVPPYGDSRAIFIRSRYNVKKYLEETYPQLRVYDRQEIVDKRLLGKDSPYIPDYIAVPLDNKGYVYVFKEASELEKLKGHHGGLSKEEMEIPMVFIHD